MPMEHVKLFLFSVFLVVIKAQAWPSALTEMLDLITENENKQKEEMASTQKYETPNLAEIKATKFDDEVFSIYQRRAQKPKDLSSKKHYPVYRIKSRDHSRPSECTNNGQPGPRIVCPTTKHGSRWWTCILPEQICDGIQNCDNGEDENPIFCMFYSGMAKQFNVLKNDATQLWTSKTKTDSR